MFNYIVKSFKDAWKFLIIKTFSNSKDKDEDNDRIVTVKYTSLDECAEEFKEYQEDLDKLPLLTLVFVFIIRIGVAFSVFMIPMYFFIKYVMGIELELIPFAVISFIILFFVFEIFGLKINISIDKIDEKSKV